MKKLKFAIIGCGRISYKHVEALVNNHAEAVLVATCDIDISKAEDKKNEYIKNLNSEYTNVKAYADYKEMLDNEDIDVVTIATESGYHAEIAIYSMNKKKHVLVEKPMALSIEDADNMIKAAKENNVKLSICHQNRFNKPIQKLREAIEKDKFAKIFNGTARILWNRNMGYYEQAPWRGTWDLDGGTLMNQCIHNIDLLQWMLGGEIQTVYSQCDTFMRSIEAEDFGAIIIRFKNGAIGIVEGSACVFPKNLEETLSVFGEKGTVVIGGLAVNELETWRFENEDEDAVKRDLKVEIDNVYGMGHTPLFENLITSINNNETPLIDGEEGKKAMSIILAAYKSRKTGLPVEFPLTDFSTSDMK
ncbi:Gfo/Idh/MocA family protein [Clostridium sp. 'White wine YQ']|uniref:Gfo/Idh/MocA family protein n=1 Tax=Clostridium sp. 'White wine YQ' TaxID=3027474 RepID=UPI002364FDED|nr:Gfo/Idh/MocA family oxidoreductase [Clostridium sp. 'White wine YQ']MDD7794974.1 Gfo/Idh/MocA family oxidoreductase [Clostridium sp. 'White wine YQ']